MSEWKELNGIDQVGEAVAAGMVIEYCPKDGVWELWNRQFWDAETKYRARKPSFSDRLKDAPPITVINCFTIPRKVDGETEQIFTHTPPYGKVNLDGYLIAPIECVTVSMQQDILEKAMEQNGKSKIKPDTKKVKSLCWRAEKSGDLLWLEDDLVPNAAYSRFPGGDIEGDVEA